MSLGVPVAVLGATGRMGRVVVAQLAQHPGATLVAAVTRPGHPLLGRDAGQVAGIDPVGVLLVGIGQGCFGPARVVIDFSLPQALAAALPHLGARALVSGTTKVPESTLQALGQRPAPVLLAPNFSLGVAVLSRLLAQAAQALSDFDLEIVETHHHHKVDAPSGTALALATLAAKARGGSLDIVLGHQGLRAPGSIGIHAVRAGQTVGEHRVVLAGPGERLELLHAAHSRQAFASGAVRAALWIDGRAPGRYTLGDVLGAASQQTD